MGRGDSANMEASPLLGAPHGTTFKPFGLFWNIVKSFAGAGTFALPWAVMNAGLWGGIVGILLVAILSNFTIRTLFKCGTKVMNTRERESITNTTSVQPPSYPDIGRFAFGELGAMTISLFSGLMCFGVCIAYYDLIGENIQRLFENKFPHIGTWEIILVVFPFTVFLSCLTDLTKLAYTSIAGSVALLAAMGSVIVYGLTNHMENHSDYSPFEWKTIPLFLGGAAFLFIDHVVLVPLANSCGSYKRFPRILDYAMIFVVIINIVFASLSYIFWGQNTCGNLINNLKGSVVGDIVRIGISLEVLASFPLVANAGFQAVETGFHLHRISAFPNYPHDKPRPFFSSNIFYYLFRGGTIALLALLASTIKDFGALVSLIGSLTIAATGFIFPQLIYLKLFRQEVKWYSVAVQSVIIIFGIGLTVLGTWQSLDAILHPAASDSPCNG